jgi:hypothetical protein
MSTRWKPGRSRSALLPDSFLQDRKEFRPLRGSHDLFVFRQVFYDLLLHRLLKRMDLVGFGSQGLPINRVRCNQINEFNLPAQNLVPDFIYGAEKLIARMLNGYSLLFRKIEFFVCKLWPIADFANAISRQEGNIQSYGKDYGQGFKGLFHRALPTYAVIIGPREVMLIHRISSPGDRVDGSEALPRTRPM